MAYTSKRVGFGSTLSWDVAGGTSFTALGNVVDGGKRQAKAKMAKTSLLSDTNDTCAKTSIDPGGYTFTIAFDPAATEYKALCANAQLMNAVAPNWKLDFVDVGDGSGSGNETFRAHVSGVGVEIKKDDFLMAEVELAITGSPGFKTA